MLTGENKSKIDKIWDAFWSGGISDPLRVIEQISFLLFIKRLDDLHTAREKRPRSRSSGRDMIMCRSRQGPKIGIFKESAASNYGKVW